MDRMSPAAEFDKLNAERTVLLARGKLRIAGWEPSEIHPNVLVPTFSTPQDLKGFYANKFVPVKAKNENGDVVTKKKPLFDFWMRHADRPTAVGMTLDVSKDRFIDGRLNLWRGFSVEPKEGKWDLIRGHITNVVCAGNASHAKYVLNWIAWSLQNPTKPAEVVLVLRGAKGAGKGWLARLLCRLFGAHAIHLSERKHVIGNFNAHFLLCCLCYLDEALWAGDKAGEGTLKRMVTEDSLTCEPKGLDAFSIPNRLTLIMTSNEDWVVPASSDERRYCVLDVADTRVRDFGYFNALNAQLENGGTEAFLHAMLNRDLRGWHPRQDVPQTAALAAQQTESSSPLERWLGGILERGSLPAWVRDPQTGYVRQVVVSGHPDRARSQRLWWHACATDRKMRDHMAEHAFYAWLTKEGIPLGQRDKHSNTRQFPPLAEARQAWNAKRAWWPMPDAPDATWAFAPEYFEDKEQRRIADGWLEQDEPEVPTTVVEG